MKFIISAVILFSLLQISTQFAFRNDFEDDDIVEVYERHDDIVEVYERHVRDTAATTDTTVIAEQSKEIIEASGEEPLPKKSVVKRDKPETEIEASGHSSEESEEVENRPKRSTTETEAVVEGSGEEKESEEIENRPKRSTTETEAVVEGSGEEGDIAGRQRRVAGGEEIIEASGEEKENATTATTA
uniref:Uncharacterized protein n=1 Tax=Panagrolaimus sp. PS1159 TaxID=55785 RepID=A0AC35GFT6_9BILA